MSLDTSLFENKNVLFITTKNLDYLRNTQETALLSKTAHSLEVLGYKDSGYIKRLLKLYTKLLFMPVKKYDLIFAGFAPQLILPFFSWKFKGKTIAEDFFISLYDTMVFDRKKFKEKSLFAKLMFWVDKSAITKAEYIITDTKAHARYFSEQFGVPDSKINVLYLEADKSIYKEMTIPKQEAWKNKFVVLYFGSVLPLQGVDTVLECVKNMEDNKDIVFDIIGPLSKAQLESFGDLKNARFTQWLPQDKLAQHIAAADLCLAGHFNKDINKALRTIPGKAYIYKAMSKPMILGDNNANRENFEEDNTDNFYVEMGSANALKEKIIFASEKIQGR